MVPRLRTYLAGTGGREGEGQGKTEKEGEKEGRRERDRARERETRWCGDTVQFLVEELRSLCLRAVKPTHHSSRLPAPQGQTPNDAGEAPGAVRSQTKYFQNPLKKKKSDYNKALEY